MIQLGVILLILFLLVTLLQILLPFALVAAAFFIIFKIYEALYFRGQKFKDIKMDLAQYISEVNQLNRHIENLKQSESIFDKKDYGVAQVNDTSKHNYKRKELDKFANSKYVHPCSLGVARNAQKQPFKYITKYFNIGKNEESIEHFEALLNDFSAVEEGKEYLAIKKNETMESIDTRIPYIIKKYSKKKLEQNLGFEEIDFSDLYFPKYTMQYISDGGNSSLEVDVNFDLDMLERFINYLAEHIKWHKSVAGQRALMTPKLRNSIKERDNYTCCMCENSTDIEPNLLLEIDHIYPLSKGGMTEVNNLQTLCWKCNRSKGAKIIEPAV